MCYITIIDISNITCYPEIRIRRIGFKTQKTGYRGVREVGGRRSLVLKRDKGTPVEKMSDVYGL